MPEKSCAKNKKRSKRMAPAKRHLKRKTEISYKAVIYLQGDPYGRGKVFVDFYIEVAF